MSTRERRRYFQEEEPKRFGEPFADDEMDEYIMEKAAEQEAMLQDTRGAKKRKLVPASDHATMSSSSTARNFNAATGSGLPTAMDVDSAPKPPVRTSPRVKKTFVPPRLEAQSLFTVDGASRSPKSLKVVPTAKRKRDDVEDSPARPSAAVPASSQTTAPPKPTLPKVPVAHPEAPLKRTTAASASALARAATIVDDQLAPGLSKSKNKPSIVDSASSTPGPSTSTPATKAKGKVGRASVTIPKKPTVALKKAPTRTEIAKAKRERAAQEKAIAEREKQMNHEEYIAYLPEKFSRYRRQKVLEGLTIFYVHRESGYRASERARARYDIVYDLGADIASRWDSERVTHIVVSDEGMNRRCMDMCGKVKNLTDIPLHIKSYTWLWVADCKVTGQRPAPEHELLREAFPERVVIPRKPGAVRNRPSRIEIERRREQERKEKEKDENADTTDSSDDEAEPTQNVSDNDDQPVAGPGGSATAGSAPAGDPLAEFYDQARYEAEDAVSGDEGREPTPPQEAPNPDAVVAFGGGDKVKGKYLKGFQCDQVGAHLTSSDCPNEDIVRVLQELMQVHESRGQPEDRWRVISYRKAISALRRYPTRIKSAEEAERLHGVGKKTADKIMEILGTGNLQRLKTEREHGHDVVALFRGIYSVGSKIAWEWYAKGLRTLDDVRERKGGIRLSASQEVGLRYYDDLNERMPRAEAGEIFGMIKQRVLDIDPNLTLEIMGSYRRRKETCGDIDILITREPSDGKTHAGVLRKLLRVLHADGILTEDLSMPHDTHALEAKYMGICRRDATSKRRRIDILTIPFEQWGGALLYFTGDDIFNRSMRLKANKMGMSLNQRGLYRNVIRDPSKWNNKLDDGELFASKTEREIFDALGVPWQEPWERVRG